MRNLFNRLGPGLLYAAAAIGVSHLIQSTRAGADFGFQLLWVVIIVNLLKYPFFRIGPKYTAVTGKSLLHGWQQTGPWAIKLFFILTLLTMFTVQAAVTTVTAGLSMELFNLEISTPLMALILLVICTSILLIGKFSLLDNFIKVIVIILTLSTIVSVIMASGADFEKTTAANPFSFSDKAHLFFLIALVGWMPAPMDVPIWHSLWSIAKNKDNNNKTDVKTALLDFNVGFIGTAVLACCFVSLGAIVMYQTGEVFSEKAHIFSAQLVSMYTNVLGSWSLIFIAIAAFATMFSTTLTCLDAFPRILAEAYRIESQSEKSTYKIWLLVTVLGASIILFGFLSNMKAMVDFATTLSFVVSPIYAYLTYKAMNADHIPEEHRTQGFMKLLAIMGLSFFTLFSLYFIYLKFLS